MSNNIKSSDLSKIWAAPDNSRLIPKQISIRLPVHVAAKLYTLEELYPTRSRTQIIGDLLSTALEDLEDSLPSVKGDEIIDTFPNKDGREPDEIEVYEDVGLKGRYFELYTKHLTEIEKQLGNEGFNKTYSSVYILGEQSILTSERIGYTPKLDL